MRNYLYLLSLIPSVLAVYGNVTGGYWAFANFFFSFFILAMLEWLTGANKSNNHSNGSAALPEFVLLMHVLANILVLGSLAYGIKTRTLEHTTLVLAALSSGAHTATSAIVIAHELIHKHSTFQRSLGKFLLALGGNIYFYIHHLRIHHKEVGTPNDAATARYNEPLYRFVVRSISGQLKQAWASETGLLKRKNKAPYSLNNYMVRAFIIQLAIFLAVYISLSWWGLLAWSISVVISAILAEYVNYIEHYGLERTENEKVSLSHSWNNDQYVSRFILIDISRHADHHFHANKPYHKLETYDESPHLPGGYAALILPALIPPLWRKIVHPVLESYKSKNNL